MQRLDAGGIGGVGRSGLDIDGTSRNDIGSLLLQAPRMGEPRESHSKGRREDGVADRLDGKGLGHDRATAGHDLEIRHGSAATDAINAGAGAGGESSEGGRRSILEEWAKLPRLTKKRFHNTGISVSFP